MGCLGRYSVTIVFLLPFFPAFGGDAAKDGGFNIPPLSPEPEMLLPAELNGGFAMSLTDHFLVAYDAAPAEARELSNQLECGLERFYFFFEQAGLKVHRPEGRLTWIRFSKPQDYSSYTLQADRMDLSHLSGYYSAKTNRVTIMGPHVDPSGTSEAAHPIQSFDIAAMTDGGKDLQSMKIAHELAHQLSFNTGLQKRGVMYPLWASEGLATQYETELSYCRDMCCARKDRLLDMLANGRLIPVEDFVSITRLPAEQPMCEDLYAQAWGFFNFLLHNRSDQLKNYLNVLYNSKPGFRNPETFYTEFTDSFGPAHLLYKEWVCSLDRR